jgi:hypothetical protein
VLGPVGDLFAKSFAECVGELRSRQVVTCNADRLANESVTASKDAERGPAEVLGSDRRRLTPSSALSKQDKMKPILSLAPACWICSL